MRIFVTGATGYIGSAITSALVHAGHSVVAMARPSARTHALREMGVELVEGSLSTIDDRAGVMRETDAVIHAASDSSAERTRLDRNAIETALENARGVFVYTSGVWVLGNTGESEADETTAPNPLALVAWRPEHEAKVLESSSDRLRTAVVRPGCVYGGRQSLLAQWFSAAEKGDPLEIVGAGTNRWSMVHLDDVADCYLKIVEGGMRGVFHAVDDSRSTIVEMARAVAETAGRGSAVQMIPLEEARKTRGSLADALAIDQQVASNRTRARLSWQPACRTFLSTIERQCEEWKQTRNDA